MRNRYRAATRSDQEDPRRRKARVEVGDDLAHVRCVHVAATEVVAHSVLEPIGRCIDDRIGDIAAGEISSNADEDVRGGAETHGAVPRAFREIDRTDTPDEG